MVVVRTTTLWYVLQRFSRRIKLSMQCLLIHAPPSTVVRTTVDQMLALILAKLQAQRPEEAADVIAQRTKAIVMAKATGGTWDKAAQVELLPPEQGSICLPSEITVAGLPA